MGCKVEHGRKLTTDRGETSTFTLNDNGAEMPMSELMEIWNSDNDAPNFSCKAHYAKFALKNRMYLLDSIKQAKTTFLFAKGDRFALIHEDQDDATRDWLINKL